ncbi:MAG: phage baseplate assembly protein V [Rhodobacter sp.]|nr:phage baseplate assembly protein V [Rhodobacter sp.]
MPEDNAQISALTGLVKEQQGKFYGTYRGIVIDNADPKNRGRLLVEVPTVLGQGVHKWAMGKFGLGGNANEAAIFVPAVSSQVLVEFVEGSPKSPIWAGVYYPDDAEAGGDLAPPDSFDLDPGTLHMLRTEAGIELRLEDDRTPNGDGGTQQVVLHHPSGTDIVIDKDGVVTVTDPESGELLLDPVNKITRLKGQGDGLLEMTQSGVVLKHGSTELALDSSGATLTAAQIKLDGDQVSLGKSATSSILNAEAFINTVFSMHTHPTPVGPSGPPVPPGLPPTATSLMKVKGA